MFVVFSKRGQNSRKSDISTLHKIGLLHSCPLKGHLFDRRRLAEDEWEELNPRSDA